MRKPLYFGFHDPTHRAFIEVIETIYHSTQANNIAIIGQAAPSIASETPRDINYDVDITKLYYPKVIVQQDDRFCTFRLCHDLNDPKNYTITVNIEEPGKKVIIYAYKTPAESLKQPRKWQRITVHDNPTAPKKFATVMQQFLFGDAMQAKRPNPVHVMQSKLHAVYGSPGQSTSPA